jgi:hypothetical protein
MLQLEPTNLLEPLDLREDFSPFAKLSNTFSGQDAAARRAATRPRPRHPSISVRRRGHRTLKAALIIVGAVACVGVGMALPQLPNLVVSDSIRSSAVEPPRNAITADTLAKPGAPPPEMKPVEIKPVETKPPDVKPSEPATNGSSQRTAADTAPPAKAADDPAANDSVANAPPCNPKMRNTDANCLAGGPPQPLTGPAGAMPDPKPVETKPAANVANAQPAATEERAPAAAPQDRKQDRSRSSSRRRDRGNWDEGRSASYWGTPDEEADRGYRGRRDRYGDDDGYRGDRRSARRGGWREEERVVERGPRIGGPPGLFGLLPFGGD